MVEKFLRSQALDPLCKGISPYPNKILGLQKLSEKDVAVILFRPGAEKVLLQIMGDDVEACPSREFPGLFFYKASAEAISSPLDYKIYHGNGSLTNDPYAFPTSWSARDEELFLAGHHESIYDKMGAVIKEVLGVRGVLFTVWAPHASNVSVVGDFNLWDGRINPMNHVSAGIWELFIPGIDEGARYKWEITTASGERILKSDPYGKSFEYPPEFSSVVVDNKKFVWTDDAWIQNRERMGSRKHLPLNIYEMHLGSWRWEDGRPMSYRRVAEELAKHCHEFHYTHVELLPVTEHPLVESWGYQVGGYYAPTRRFGSLQDFQYLVNFLHEQGIGVILDWVPAHFPVDDFIFSNFDGTPLYESMIHREYLHPHWGTYTFDYTKKPVVNFLLGSALFWIKEMHIDGLRFDAVASMLYLDYGREQGEWTPNKYGGRENLEAQSFIRTVNAVIHQKFPGVITFAEESTSFPNVTVPVEYGGLGFDYKWNMGWMNDTFFYFRTPPHERASCSQKLTFGLMYAFSESFVLPFSHDEVVHEKGSLIGKMPGDRQQQFAHLRLLLSYQMCQVGKKLSFMGTELALFDEWSPNRELQMNLLEDPDHRMLNTFVKSLNYFYINHPPLWEKDCDPEGFQWVTFSDTDNHVIAYIRSGYKAIPYSRTIPFSTSSCSHTESLSSGLGDDQYRLLCIHHFGTQTLTQYLLPYNTSYAELLLNSNDKAFGGDGFGGFSSFLKAPSTHSETGIFVDIPPLTTLIIKVKD